ncbi:MAG: hypothetical protein HY235_06430, partial [Acidobacteria bacterium]|nr:hypothetical protein [Acidobacteriota bacterium]
IMRGQTGHDALVADGFQEIPDLGVSAGASLSFRRTAVMDDRHGPQFHDFLDQLENVFSTM